MTASTIMVGITGISGYVGSFIAGRLRQASLDCVGLVRRPELGDRRYALDAAVPEGALDNIDTLVHCAWDMRAASWSEAVEVNVEGTRRLLAAASAAGVKRFVFISSMSAFEGCQSVYGKSKLAAERAVLDADGIVVRPGLIYGDLPGGITGALAQLARKLPVLPMIGTGRFRLHPCHEDDLAELILYICTHDMPVGGVFTAAQRDGCEFRDIVQAVAGRSLVFIPVPWQLAWAALRSAEAIGLRTRLKSDSLLGLVKSDPSPDFSMTAQLPVTFRYMNTMNPIEKSGKLL